MAVPQNANVRDVIRKLMKDNNYDPFKEMILIAKDPDTDRRLRATMASELAQYVAPKLKGIDIDAKASGSIQVIVQRFADEVLDANEPKTLELAPLAIDEGNPDEVEETTDEEPGKRKRGRPRKCS